MKNTQRRVPWLAAAAAFLLTVSSSPALASSHMDAPLITLDDAANTTDFSDLLLLAKSYGLSAAAETVAAPTRASKRPADDVL